jgi:predicted Holliday junction resolvase-like endonuclease
LRKLAPHLYNRAINLQDVKVIFHPVESIVFHGLTKERCTLLEFVDHPAETKEREGLQHCIEEALTAGNVEWRTFRIQLNGNITEAR